MQEKALEVLMNGQDCICSLPTGYGKSLIYELLPYIDEGCLVIIIVPLNAIIKQQVQKLTNKAMSLSKESSLSQMKSREVNYIFSHPEDILENREVNRVFILDFMKERKKYLVVDEAHCILEWGEEFRPDFRKLAQLRAIFKCQVLALSATVTEFGQKQIMSNLLMTNCKTVCASPTKDNIQLIVKKRPSATRKGNTACSPYDYIFKPVITELNREPHAFPITIIYCKSMQWIGYGNEMSREILGDNFYDGDKTPDKARVVMFHSAMEKKSGQLKDMILASLQKPEEECCIRLIISSVALGMGADLKHVRRVIHAGPPTSLETYVQEIGRSGRAGCSAHAILYYNNGDLAVQGMRQEMKEYCKSVKCKRSTINEYFGFHSEQSVTICCNSCQPMLGVEWDFENLSISEHAGDLET